MQWAGKIRKICKKNWRVEYEYLFNEINYEKQKILEKELRRIKMRKQEFKTLKLEKLEDKEKLSKD